jgi:uncharacterized membrane protein
VLKVLRRHFLTGLVALTPLAITLWVLWRLYELIDSTLRPWLQRVLPSLSETYPSFILTFIAAVAFVLLITLVGLFTRNLIGIAFFGLVERFFDKIPGVRSLFSATKQIAEVLLADHRSAFKQVVLFEYPRRGVFSIGFVTADTPGHDFLNVFLPTTPNPTSGYLLMVPRDEAAILPLNIEEGVRLIISGGSVMNAEQAAALRATSARLAANMKVTTPPGREEPS